MKTQELFLVTDSNKVNIVETLIQNIGTCDVTSGFFILDANADIRQQRGMPLLRAMVQIGASDPRAAQTTRTRAPRPKTCAARSCGPRWTA